MGREKGISKEGHKIREERGKGCKKKGRKEKIVYNGWKECIFKGG